MIHLSATSGERLEPLAYEFQDSEGAPLDLGGFTGIGVWVHDGGTTGTFALAIDDATATGTLPELALEDPGTVDVVLWVGNGGTLRFASHRWRFAVADAPGDVPDI